MYATIAKEDENDFKKFIEDLKYEPDVTRYYRKLQESISNSSPIKTTKKFRMKSKSTQTDLESSSVPLFWLMSCQKIVSNLNAGLSNLIRHCETDVKCDVENTKENYEYSEWQDFQDDSFKEEIYKQKIHIKDLKQDLYKLLEHTTRLQDAFLSLGNKRKIFFNPEYKLCVSKVSMTEGHTIDVDPLSEENFCGFQRSDNYSLNIENADDFEVNQDFLESQLPLKKDTNKYFEMHSCRKNRMFEEINTSGASYGIAVSTYNLKQHPRSSSTEMIDTKTPKSKISCDLKLNHTNERNFADKKGIFIIGGKISDPRKTLGGTVHTNAKTSDKNSSQMNKEKHQDKDKFSNLPKKM